MNREVNSMNEKVTLEFDKEPTLIFVQRKPGNDFNVYQDGEEVKGIRTIRIDAVYNEFTTHEIEYLTGQTKSE